jgi:hypothetical protein
MFRPISDYFLAIKTHNIKTAISISFLMARLIVESLFPYHISYKTFYVLTFYIHIHIVTLNVWDINLPNINGVSKAVLISYILIPEDDQLVVETCIPSHKAKRTVVLKVTDNWLVTKKLRLP